VTRRVQTCSRLFSSRRRVREDDRGSSTGNAAWGQSNVGKPRRARLRCVAARLPSVRPWKAPSNDTMKGCSGTAGAPGESEPGEAAAVFTRLRSIALMAFSTASAPVFTTK
jgi:hypothetical protein